VTADLLTVTVHDSQLVPSRFGVCKNRLAAVVARGVCMESKAAHSVRSAMESSERLLWTGHPRQGLRLQGSDAFLIPFSIMWGGFAIFWELSALNMGAPAFFAVWGVPFVTVGLYMMVGRFVVDARTRSVTYYGLTDKRVIILTGLLQRRVKSVSLQTLQEVELAEGREGRGTITFGPQPSMGFLMRSNIPGWPGPQSPTVLDDIPQARSVYNQILRAREEAFKK